MFQLGEFRFLVATQPEMRSAAHRLRHKVYVEEYKFEMAENAPDGLERDEFDPYSIQFVAQDSHGRVVGTVRLIQNSCIGLPVLNLCREFYQDKNPESCRIAEISRLTLDTSLSGTTQGDSDGMEYFLKKLALGDLSPKGTAGIDKRVVVLLGLIQILSQVADALSITDLYLVAEKRLMVLLKRQGIVFHQVGPEFDYHGLRAPFVGHASELGPVTYLFRNQMAEKLERRSEIPFLSWSGVLRLGGLRFFHGRRVADQSNAVGLRESGGGARRDIHDSYARHILAKDSANRLVGTIRLIPNSCFGLPSLTLASPEYQCKLSSSSRVAEIADLATCGLDQAGRNPRRESLLILGLVQMAHGVARELRITTLILSLSSDVARRLIQAGFALKAIGAADASGKQPFLIRADDAARPCDWRSAAALAVDAARSREMVGA